MAMRNEKRLGRLPLYVAMMAAMPLGMVSAAAFAAEFDKNSAGIAINNDENAPTKATQVDDIAIGNGAEANSGDPADGNKKISSVAIGNNAKANVEAGVAIGDGAEVRAKNSVALGAGSTAEDENVVSVGTATMKRRVVGLDAGREDTDAVNVKQLKDTVASIGGSVDGSNGDIKFDKYKVGNDEVDTVKEAVEKLDDLMRNSSAAGLEQRLEKGEAGLTKLDQNTLQFGRNVTADTIDFGYDNGTDIKQRKLTGIADGEGEYDAVSGKQLNQLKAHSEKLGVQINELNTAVQGGADNNSDLIAQDDAGLIQIGQSKGGKSLSVAGIDGARKISGVAEGELTETSTDAVNGKQVKGLQDEVNVQKGAVTQALLETLDLLGKSEAIKAGRTTVYSDEERSRIQLDGKDGTVIDNLADGAIEEGSKQAITGGQLKGAQSQINKRVDEINQRLDGASIGNGDGNGNFTGDMNGQRLTNVGDGVEDTDAANLGQVKSAAAGAVQQSKDYTDASIKTLNDSFEQYKGSVSDRFRQLDRRVDRIGAMSMANTQMAMNAGGVEGGNGRIAMGVGVQNSRTALSVGYAAQTSDRTRVSFGASFSGAEASVGAGAGFDL